MGKIASKLQSKAQTSAPGTRSIFANNFSWCGLVARMTMSDPKGVTTRMYLIQMKCGVVEEFKK